MLAFSGCSKFRETINGRYNQSDVNQKVNQLDGQLQHSDSSDAAPTVLYNNQKK